MTNSLLLKSRIWNALNTAQVKHFVITPGMLVVAARQRYSAVITQFFVFTSFLIFLTFTTVVVKGQINFSVFNDFRHYTEENGLASNYIVKIQEDNDGFLWIATGNGISRYDGNYFANFAHHYENSIEHEIGFVGSILFDTLSGQIWIGNNNGIFYTSIDTIDFRRAEELVPSLDYASGKVADLLLDENRTLWVASKGLLGIDLNAGKHKTFLFEYPFQEDKFFLNSLECIVKDPVDPEKIWIGTKSGLVMFNTETHAYHVYVYNGDPELPQNRIRKIQASEEEVLLGTWTEGLIVFNKRTQQFRELHNDQASNSHQLILDIFKERNDGNFWITSDDGLILYDGLSKSIVKTMRHSLENGVLRGVSYIDSRGIVWYCSQKGLFKFDRLQSQDVVIELEKRSSVEQPFLVRKIVLSNGFYYVLGHAGSGLYKISSKDYSFEVIDYPTLTEKAGKKAILRDMVEMEDGNFLIASGKEITIFNPKTEQIKLSSLQIDHPYPSIQALIKGTSNTYWVGTRAAGLYLLDFENNIIKNFREEFNVFEEGNHLWINSLYLDSKNKLWIGKGSACVMDLNDTSIICIDPTKKYEIITYQDVYEYYEDKQGRVWMAGVSNGLGFSNFENFQKGISHQVDGYITGVFPYNDSLLWVTGKNLGIFNLNTLNYREIEFSSNNKKLRVSGPIVSSGNGKFIIGCDNGVLIHDPEKRIVNTEVPLPYIRKIESDGKSLYEGNDLTLKDFRLKSGTKYLVFTISSLGFHLSEQITYQYRFEGEWRDISDNNEVHLTNLSYGDYRLEIKACNNLGRCNDIPKVYLISILTPWWATWWAILIYIVVVILTAVRFYRFQLTKRLAIEESLKLREINRVKSSLYTNITHEFRTPLTVILGMVDHIKSNLKDNEHGDAGHTLDMIKSNGKNLLRLVNEMLDLSKLESGNMDLQLIQADVIPFIKYLCDSFNSLAQEKQIHLTVYSEIDQLIMDFDTNKLSTIVTNLLSNALKFTPPGGKIIVHLNNIYRGKNDYFFIKVKDTGKGIQKEDLNNIFNRFYQVHNSSARHGEGTGIGLTLTREFVELLNGTITVNSIPDKGSEFIVLLPIMNTAKQTEGIQMHPELIPEVSLKGQEIEQQSWDDSPDLPLALIIEDNADVVHYLKMCLTGKYQTIHEADGASGIQRALETIPDIIVCDIMMPVKDGFEVCSTLKADERTDHIPVIMLTAKVTMKDKLQGLSSGADAYLTKPFVKAELLTRIDQLVLLRRKMIKKLESDSFNQFLKQRAENPESKFLQKIIRIIHEEINNHSFGSSLHLSQKMNLSESQIYRKLKAITGKSTAVFIRTIRLQKARELILTTDKTISEIAYEVGFNDPSWFSRAFKEEFGYSPSAISK